MHKRHWILFLSLFTVILVSGCVDVSITQDLDRDITASQELVIVVETTESYVADVNDAIKRMDCRFSMEEKQIGSSVTITYTSNDCLIDEDYVTYAQIGRKLRYSMSSAIWSQEGFESTYLDEKVVVVNVDGWIDETNGYKLSDSSVKFRMSDDDVDNSFVYYVDYRPRCSDDSECESTESCVSSKCTPLECGYCEYISQQNCMKYECCGDDDCEADNYCSGHKCLEVVQTSSCGEMIDHTWVEYECCSNSDCGSDESCVNHSCSTLSCEDCEYIEDHQCKRYQCCSNVHCGGDEHCINPYCVPLYCSFFEKGENHTCTTNILLLGIVGFLGGFTLFIIIIVFVFLLKRKK